MAGITLETAKRHLDAWLEAELAVTKRPVIHDRQQDYDKSQSDRN